MRPIQESGAMLRKRRISARELVDESLARAAEVNPKLNAFMTMTADKARAEAGALDAELAAGTDRGPLHGIPVAVKDCYETRGVRTTCGSKLFTDFIPDRDAAVVERLRIAGAVLIGKTTMHELAYGVTSTNPHFGPVRNPWNTGAIPGGSSGGSGAAVAARVVAVAMGSDTGGSIRLPAAYCGCAGIKPTSGRVSRYGVMPLDYSLDHMGPLTLTVRDAAIVLKAIAGYDKRDDTSSPRPVGEYLPERGAPLDGLRIGLPRTFFFDHCDPAVESGVREAARVAARRGATVVDVNVPDIAAINATARVILLAEATACLAPFLDRRADFGADVLALFDQGKMIAAPDYINAQRLRRMQQRAFSRVFDDCDVLFTPVAPMGAPKIGQTTVDIGGHQEDTRLASTRLVRSINLLGLPALAMPCGQDAAGMPVSLQIVGRSWEEATVLRIGAAIEEETAWHKMTPPL